MQKHFGRRFKLVADRALPVEKITGEQGNLTFDGFWQPGDGDAFRYIYELSYRLETVFECIYESTIP